LGVTVTGSRPRTGEKRAGEKKIPLGRRLFIGMGALGVLGVLIGSKIQSVLSSAAGSGLGGLLPGGNHWRIYTITGNLPEIPTKDYRLEVTGLVERPMTLTLADLEAMPKSTLVRTFQCVTGWTVPDVHWEGVRLSTLLDRVGVKPEAVALSFESYDGADSESLTLEQARLPDVIVAYRMLGGPVSTEHGGPVRLYVAPMFGYKSLKWLSAVRVVAEQVPGFWEENGYPVNGWLTGSTSPTIPRGAA
jgi:DMSO/TMAO reductase YedYZ molybdopterin-dependent catalytic subunit